MATVADDVKALTDGDLFRRLSEAIRAIPMISEADREAWERAWREVRRYQNELARRYQRSGAPSDDDSPSRSGDAIT